MRHQRDRALVLLGFWRGFRGDELIRVQVEHLRLVPGEGMTCFLPRSKGDRQAQDNTYKVPALSRLCPVTATWEWIDAAGMTEGPLFRGVDRWGHVADEALHPNSLIPLLRHLLTAAGLPDAEEYSGHSLRRGFAGWANANGWDVKALMEYVGWRDVHSAMRYIEGGDPGRCRRMLLYLRQAWEQRLARGEPASVATLEDAIREGAVLRVRPKAMTVAVILAGLFPLFVGTGAGSEVMQRIAAPMLGGRITAPLLSMLVIPAAYRIWMARRLR